MAITGTDIVLRYSVVTGSAGDSVAGTMSGALGRYVSTTVAASGANGLFDNVSGADNLASTVDYRCIFVLNNHATLTMQNSVVYVSAEVVGGTVISIAVDNTAATAKNNASAQAAQIASETSVPAGVGAFSSPTTAATGLVLGDILPGFVRAIWIKRAAANTPAVTGDGFTLAVGCDTAA